MFNLKAIAFKLFRAAKAQVMTSISIIAITICLITTMGVYIWNAKAQMDAEMHALFGDAEMTVGFNPEQQKWITAEQYNSIASTEGISEASPVFLTHTTIEGILPTVYTIGAENDDLVKSRYHFESDLGNNEVIISAKIASLFSKSVGDTIDVEYTPFIIKEILDPLPGVPDVELVILSNATVKQWVDLPDTSAAGLFSLLKLQEDALPSLISNALIQVDDEFRIDITNEYDFVKANFQALAIFMIVLSTFVFIVAAVLLLSTFQLMFFKLREQLMVLRALGATAKQVGKIVQIQLSAIIGSGVIAGILLSMVVIHQWLPFLIRKMRLPEAHTEFPFGLAISIAVIAFVLLQVIMQWQVQKSMQLLPMQIEEENHEPSSRLTKVKLYVLGLISACALLILFSSVFEENDGKSALQTVIGSLLICVLVLYMMPFLFSRLLKLILQPVRILFGKEAYLACNQLMPQVRRNMPIVLSIIGLMVILIFGTALFKTIHHNEKAYIDFLYETPVVIHNDLLDPTLTTEITRDIEALPTVEYAYARSDYHYLELHLENLWQGADYQAIDVKKFVEKGKIREIHGDIENGVIVSEKFAEDHSLSIGDVLQPAIYNLDWQSKEEVEPVKIIGTISSSESDTPILFDWSAPIAINAHLMVDEIMVQTAEIEQTMAALQFLHEQWPALTFSDYETFTAQSDQLFFQRWSLFAGVMFILITATCLGVIQTLLHTIYGKRNDYAVQRLIGLTPNGLVKLILTQVLSFVLYGLAVGTILGVIFTQLLALIDTDTAIVFDYKTILFVTCFFLLAVCLIFTLQGRWISRRTLGSELGE
ncbi:ABC transporter permease [Sporosarcina oncorhynchi]|uniref:ABC transporter permease n=1 Tax=Sporosarcina oncorhynchi TaxID=3056444 RepID=A0ABZ0L5C6_9BACL|nr:FtsX-like permease family protein [Sporosarcina sp. T2O-4]WOV87675.1 ABC transporter permease [Sporosarcina sp. T2O-4]